MTPMVKYLFNHILSHLSHILLREVVERQAARPAIGEPVATRANQSCVYHGKTDSNKQID